MKSRSNGGEAGMDAIIRAVSGDDDIARSTEIIRASFAPVARRFHLTRGNCPSHPSFIEPGALVRLREKGALLCGIFPDGQQAGFMALEDGGGGTFYLEKLAVLPGCRCRGLGGGLVEFASVSAAGMGGRRISIGIIGAHDDLKSWYLKRGFVETGMKRFDHLPFGVCFLERPL